MNTEVGNNYDPITMDPPTIDPDFPMAIKRIMIDSHGDRMVGLIFVASGAGPNPCVVLVHSLGGYTKDLDLAHALQRAGFNVLFYQSRGHWGSEGVVTTVHGAEDVASALVWLRSDDTKSKFRIDTDRIAAISESGFGASAVAMTGSKDLGLRCVGFVRPSSQALFLDSGKKRGVGSGEVMSQNFGGDIIKEAATYMLPMRLEGVPPTASLEERGEVWLRDQISTADEFNPLTLAEKFQGKNVLVVSDGTRIYYEEHFQAFKNAFESNGAKVRAVKPEGKRGVADSGRIWYMRQVLDWLRTDCGF